jgi:dienelactone hydrolase
MELKMIALPMLAMFGISLLCAASAQEVKAPVGDEAYNVLKAFYDYDPDIPLEARVVELKDRDKSIRRKVVFRSARAFMVPGYLEVPKDVEPPYPCVLLMHGWSGCKDKWWEKCSYDRGKIGARLIENGIAVFALDALGHGDRIAENDYHCVNLYNEPGTTPRKNYFTLREIVVQTVVDYRRGLDYLATRGDIDMTRIGIIGYSMGGFSAFPLTAVDSRIKAVVACVAPTSWGHDVVLAPSNYVPAIGDRPFCMINGLKDDVSVAGPGRELYALLEGPNTELHFIDAGHILPAEWADVAESFIVPKL